ncbi:MAG TPA: penicillin acylase family protein [Actinomycetota bacterium]|nr:penicillin acylase family protein [Actinomycetota bacterium]
MNDWTQEIRAAAQAALAPLEGEIDVPGLAEPVEVLRDRWGIPYLTASSLDDLWFAQGFVTASERLFQIDLALRAATGRLSELFAELTLPQDRFARVVGFGRIGQREAERWSPASRAMVERFVAGARAWVEVMPAPPVEYALLAVPPDLPAGLGPWAAAFAYAAWGLSGNWDLELLRVHLLQTLGPQAAGDLLPPLPSTPPEAVAGGLAGRLLDAMPRARGQGSNNWVVAGSRTATGKPLLANDPHLLAQQPIAWFELHLRAPGYEARGVAFPFAPGVLVGATPHHAWGITNVSGDVQDLYEERLNEDGSAAEFDGGWEPVTVHREQIAVRGGDPVAVDVRETRHGPILEAETIGIVDLDFVPLDRAYALRWTATDGLLEPSALVDAAAAADFDEFRYALRGLSCPGQNVVYADVNGTIGYQLTGRYPVRRSADGSVPVPGWTSEHEWDGWIPFDDLPWSVDPARGHLVTANNRTHGDEYPHLIGRDLHAAFRARRITELIEAASAPLTPDDFARLQVDTVSLPARALLPRLTALDPRTEDERWALGLLQEWDADQRADSAAAAVYNAWVAELARTLLASADAATVDRYLAWREPFVCLALPELLERQVPSWVVADAGWDELLRRSLASTLGHLAERLGPDRSAWRWGALHQVRFAHPLARMPGLAELFVAAEHELGGDEQTVFQAGFDGRTGFEPVVVPSWRFVADLAALDRSAAVLTTGQSGNPASPHWNDQARLWIAGELRPAPMTRPGVEAAAVHRLTLRPAR